MAPGAYLAVAKDIAAPSPQEVGANDDEDQKDQKNIQDINEGYSTAIHGNTQKRPGATGQRRRPAQRVTQMQA
jgi:hypothetical protein